MKKSILHLSWLAALAVSGFSLQAAIKYWDIDGTTEGAEGATPNGLWDVTAPNWNTDATGGAGGSVTTWDVYATHSDTAVFSAGADATGAFTVTIGDGAIPMVAGYGSIVFEEGSVTVKGTSIGDPFYGYLYAYPNIAGSDATISVAGGATATIDAFMGRTAANIVKTGPGTLYANTMPHGFGNNAAGSQLRIEEGVWSVSNIALVSSPVSDSQMGRVQVVQLGGSSTSGTWEFTGAGGSLGTGGTLHTAVILGAGGGTINNTGGGSLQILCAGAISGAGGLTIAGNGTVRIGGSNHPTPCTYLGDTLVNAGATLKNGNANILPHGVSAGNLTLNGSLDVWGSSVSCTVNGLSGSGTVYSSGYNATIPGQIYIGDNDQSSTFSGNFATLNGLNWLAVTKIGAGTLTVTETSSTVGSVTNRAGTLALTGSGAFPYVYRISLGAGTTFDVTGGSSSPYHIGSTNELEATTGTGATATVAGLLTLDTGAKLALSYASGTPAIDIPTGTLTLNANPTMVNVTGGALPSGNSYTLISKSASGSVAGTAGALSIEGDGVAGGGTPTLSVVAGQLVLSISAATPSAVPATNLSIVVVGPTSRTLAGNGATNSPYNVYASTNVTTPMSNWWLLGTTNSDGGGMIQFLDFQATNLQRFYRFGQTVTP